MSADTEEDEDRVEFTHDGQSYLTPDSAWTWGAAQDGDAAWLFWFGAVGSTAVLIYEKMDLADALEAAAEEAPDYFYEIEDDVYQEAAQDLYPEEMAKAEEGDDWSDMLSPGERDAVREQAEMDMTYTETGWIPSWEWGVQEIEPPNALYAAGVVAYLTSHGADVVDESNEEVEETLTGIGATAAQVKKVIAALPDEKW